MPQSMVIGAAITTRTRVPRLGAHLQDLSHHFSQALDSSGTLKHTAFNCINLIIRICSSGNNTIGDVSLQGSELHATYHVVVDSLIKAESVRDYLDNLIKRNTLEVLRRFKIKTEGLESFFAQSNGHSSQSSSTKEIS